MIKAFLKKNKLMRTSGKDTTHLDMSGGVFSIPPIIRDEFIKVVADAYDSGEKYYLIESKTPVCRAFMDLDFLNPIAMSMDLAKAYITVIQKSIKKLFMEQFPDIYTDNFKFRVVVFTTASKNVHKDGKDYLKTGIHLIWPDFVSTKQLLMKIRTYVIKSLYEELGERPEHNSHEDVVDETVFKGSGLRIPGASKMEVCKSCKNKKDARMNCQVCNSKGRVEDPRRYTPYCVMDSSGTLLQDELDRYTKGDNSTFTLLKELSIQTDLLQVPTELDLNEKLDEIMKYVTKKGKPKKTRGRPSTNKSKTFSEFRRKRLAGELESNISLDEDSSKIAMPHDELFNSVQKFIRSREFKANKPYKDIDIKELLKCDDGEYYIVTTGCKYCLNLGDEHLNNNIYFYIDSNYIYQKCLCSCEKIRKNGKVFCKDWRSPGVLLDDIRIKKKLFPDAVESQKGGKGGIMLELCDDKNVTDPVVLNKALQREERFLIDLEHFLKNKAIG